MPNNAASPDEVVDLELMRDRVDVLMGCLTEREQAVLKARYGLEDGRPKSLSTVAKMLGGMSRERVRQLEMSGMRKLRVALKAKSRGDRVLSVHPIVTVIALISGASSFPEEPLVLSP